MGSWKDKNLIVNDKLNPGFYSYCDSLTSSILKDYREDTFISLVTLCASDAELHPNEVAGLEHIAKKLKI